MKTQCFGMAALAAATIMSSAAGPAAARPDGQSIVIALTGAAEGPGLGDPDGRGSAELRIDPHAGQFCYVLTVTDIAPAQLAHIHQSPVGEAGGPIIVHMEPPTDGSSEGCVAIPTAVAQELLRNPAEYYVNVHNPEHPGGAVRGQLG